MKKLLVVLALFSAHVFATPVNVNTADAKTIASSLTGIGAKKAEAIVADRTKNGPFKSVDDLKRVSGIGEKTISANKADILLSDVKAIAPNPTPAPVPPPATPPAKK
jgi:competence protein ComEA